MVAAVVSRYCIVIVRTVFLILPYRCGVENCVTVCKSLNETLQHVVKVISPEVSKII